MPTDSSGADSSLTNCVLLSGRWSVIIELKSR